MEDKENREIVDASKVKEEKLEVAGKKCWRKNWLVVLQVTGEISNSIPIPRTPGVINTVGVNHATSLSTV